MFKVGADPALGEHELEIPYWALTTDELLPICFGNMDDNAREFVSDRLRKEKLKSLQTQPRSGITEDDITADSTVPFSAHGFWFDFYRDVFATHSAKGADNQNRSTEMLELDGNSQPVQPGDAMAGIPPRYMGIVTEQGLTKIFMTATPAPVRRQLESFGAKLRDPRMNFLFRCGRWMPDSPDSQPSADIDELLQAWIGSDKPITILDLSGIPSAVLDTVIASSIRIIFDALYWARDEPEGGRKRPLLLVLEEAHRYLRKDLSGRSTEIVQKVVREGRKYGIGLMAVSQRPSELDPTVISQCGTLIAMRLTNRNDQNAISSAASDTAGGLTSLLPTLRTGEAIVIGEAASLPLRVRVDLPADDRRPESSDPLVYDESGLAGWNAAPPEKRDYAEVVRSWRTNAQ